MNNTGSEELSLRDVYQVLKRHARLIWGLPIAVAVLTLGVTLVLPKTYSSRVVYSLNVQNPVNGPAVFPTAQVLAQGYSELLDTSTLAPELGEADPNAVYKSSFDDRKGVWTLSAKGSSPSEAQLAVTKLSTSVAKYLDDQLTNIARQNQTAALELAKIQVIDARDQLRRIEPLLKQAQTSGGSSAVQVTGANPVAAALEGQGVNAQAARSTNPSTVSLALQVNTLRLNVANLESRIASAQRLLGSPQDLRESLGQAIMLRQIAAPGEPLEPDFPRPLLFTALAAVLAFLVAIVAAFVIEALRDPTPRPSNTLVPNPAD
jgi:LPS O-antigen subunit length determinant protein (WzzB/FepE family)